MAFFGEGTTAVALEVEPIASYIENYHEAMLAVVAESEGNFNSIMTAVGAYENKTLRESGETVLNESVIKSFWEKVKKFFMSIFAKIKGIFHNFMSRFDAQFKGGKAFYDKYKKELAEKFGKIDKDKIKFVGYNFKNHTTGNSDNTTNVTTAAAGILGISATHVQAPKDLTGGEASTIVDNKEKIDDAIEKYRGDMVNASPCTASEFNKELHQYFRDGETSKVELDIVNLAYLAGILGTDKASKSVSDSYKTLTKDIEALIKVCDKAQDGSISAQTKDPSNTGAGHQTAAYPIITRVFKDILAVKQAYLGAQLTAISNEISQAKGFASQVIRSSAVKESASWESYGESSDDIFGSVQLR